MNTPHRGLRCVLRVLTLAGASTLASCQTNAAANEQPGSVAERRGSHVWIERPWEMRYFLGLSGAWSLARASAAKRNAKSDRTSLYWEGVFDPQIVIPLPDAGSPTYDRLSVTTIEFDKQGLVTTPHSSSKPLRGRLNRLQYVTLSTGEGPVDPQYDLGHWFTGLGDASTHWAPAVCMGSQRPDAAMARSETYLYGKLFKPDPYRTSFGCREWAYQLYDDERPYIDVTSYIPKAQDPDGAGTYIRDFIGWARFNDKKPVIGKHENTWYCLHDCPGGDKPGTITDIKAWAVKNGWHVPKRPTKMPVFPDPPAAPGTYPK